MRHVSEIFHATDSSSMQSIYCHHLWPRHLQMKIYFTIEDENMHCISAFGNKYKLKANKNPSKYSLWSNQVLVTILNFTWTHTRTDAYFQTKCNKAYNDFWTCFIYLCVWFAQSAGMQNDNDADSVQHFVLLLRRCSFEINSRSI